MNVLVVGNGGREHCLAWKLSQSPYIDRLYCQPGNPGTRVLTHENQIDNDDIPAFVEAHDVQLVIFGPEAPLVAGIADQVRAMGVMAIGPSQAAAQIEGSKSYAKDVMTRAGVPTAAHRTVTTHAEAKNAIAEFGCPVVLKMDGLAGGKGVVVAQTFHEAEEALHSLMPTEGPRLVIEEFLKGEETSYIVLTDGKHFMALPPAQDHKRIFDGDLGPNTGGMGAFSDDRLLTLHEEEYIKEHIIRPVLKTMRESQTPFQGFLYAGLMMTPAGPKVLEFNARLGDPETQVLLPRIDGDFLPYLVAAANHELVDENVPRRKDVAVTVVAASAGYPGKARTGDEILGIEAAERTGCAVFQAGTQSKGGGIVTSGGRVLAVTACAQTLPAAIDLAYAGVEKIEFPGMQVRRDIGHKGLKRWVSA